MERLTERGEDGRYFVRESGAEDLTIRKVERISPGHRKWTCWWEYAVSGSMVDRLAAYEDTGLTPEEIQIQKEAMESMGWFGKMFQSYKGDPRGPIGTLGTALGKSLALLIVESAKNRQPVKDVDGNTWLPMLLDEFESMADVIEHGQEWIPVEERLPEKHSEYIVCACDEGEPIDERIWGDTVVVCADYYDGGFTWYEGNTEYDISDIVTHWMPLPQPPKEETYEK